MRLLFAHKKSCGGANLWRSVSLKQRVTYRIGVHSMPDTAFRGATKSGIRHSAFGWTCLNYVVPVFNRLTSSEISIYENWRKLLKRSRELEKRTQRKKKTSPNNKDKRFMWAVRDFLTRTKGNSCQEVLQLRKTIVLNQKQWPPLKKASIWQIFYSSAGEKIAQFTATPGNIVHYIVGRSICLHNYDVLQDFAFIYAVSFKLIE